MDEKRIDTAAEPVEIQDDDEFTDTGVLHERPEKDEDESDD
jgi:hypothetical protein